MLFWQMFLIDTLLVSVPPLASSDLYSYKTQSFYAGRPPNVSLDWIDAPYPDDEFPVKNDKGELEMSCKYDLAFRGWPNETGR